MVPAERRQRAKSTGSRSVGGALEALPAWVIQLIAATATSLFMVLIALTFALLTG